MGKKNRKSNSISDKRNISELPGINPDTITDDAFDYLHKYIDEERNETIIVSQSNCKVVETLDEFGYSFCNIETDGSITGINKSNQYDLVAISSGTGQADIYRLMDSDNHISQCVKVFKTGDIGEKSFKNEIAFYDQMKGKRLTSIPVLYDSGKFSFKFDIEDLQCRYYIVI